MEKSKLPVLRNQKPNASDPSVPCPKKSCPPKPVLPLYSKDPNIAFGAAVTEFGAFKGAGAVGKKPAALKKTAPLTRGKKPAALKKTAPLTRGPMNRRLESELKDKNQLLEAANATLQSNLLSTQKTVKELSGKQEELEEELRDTKQRLEKNQIIFQNYNIDPVAGEKVLAREEEYSKIREERRAVTKDLMSELKLLTVSTNEQTELFRNMKEKWRQSDESRKQFLEEQEAFQRDMDQFQAALEETKAWLAL